MGFVQQMAIASLAILLGSAGTSLVNATSGFPTEPPAESKNGSVNTVNETNSLVHIKPSTAFDNTDLNTITETEAHEGTPVSVIIFPDGDFIEPRIPVATSGIRYKKYSDRWYTLKASQYQADVLNKLSSGLIGLGVSKGNAIAGVVAGALFPSNIFKKTTTYTHVVMSYAKDSVNTYIKVENWAYRDKAHKKCIYHNKYYQTVPRK